MAGSGDGDRAAEPADALAQEAAELAAEVSEEKRPAGGGRLPAALASAAASGARPAGRGIRATRQGVRATRLRATAGLDRLSAQVLALALRLRVRDRAALHAQFPGRSAEEIAVALIGGAARAAAAVGGAAGAAAALPVLPAFPAEIAAETLTLVGIEIKLVAELHEVYGMAPAGSGTERATAYAAAWAHRRGVFMVPGGFILAAGSPLARLLRWRLAARAGRSALSLGPLLSGVAAGALMNHRETRRLGEQIHADLRRRAVPGSGPPGPS
jgi:hypothetical protein